jgi:two-component system, sensor histidine kinase
VWWAKRTVTKCFFEITHALSTILSTELSHSFSADAPYTSAREGLPINRQRVLVVDDQFDAAQSLAVLLIQLGHQAQFLTDPRAAVDAAETFRPSIVFLDINMPDINGWDLARALRARYGFEALRIVAITGYGSDEDVRKSRAAGFDTYITKPVSLELIQEVVAETSS